MIKKIAFLLLLTSFNTFSQIKFEKGYFIDNSNNKKECLIKNEDWLNNPYEFKYKNDSVSEIKRATVKDVKEFFVDNTKYERFEVQIDKSSRNIDQITSKKDPEWIQKQVFLKCLVVNKTKLYSYIEENISERFFYAMDGNPVQLIYKEFLNSEGNLFANEEYKQQLWNEVKCEPILKQINNLKYDKYSLIKYFNKINECNGFKASDETLVLKQKSKSDFRALIGGRVSDYQVAPSVDFGQLFNLGIGAEYEYFLPFNRNKWSLVVSSIYNFKVEKEIIEKNAISSYDKLYRIENSSINLLFGGRYNMFLSNSSRLFFRGSFSLSINDSKLQQNYISNPSIVSTINFPNSSGFLIGFGFEYKKLSAEFRYTENSILDTSTVPKQNLGFSLGYTIFTTNKK